MSSLQPVSRASYESMSDTELVQASKLGDAGAYGALTTKYWHSVCRFLQKCVRVPHHEAEELVQDAFFRGWKAIVRYCAEKGSFRTWIYSIAINAARDYWRMQRRRELLLAQHLLEIEIRQEHVPDQPADPDMSEIVSRILSVLPEKHIRIIRSHYFGGLTHRQISEREHIPLGTIKSWIRGGLMKLKFECSYIRT